MRTFDFNLRAGEYFVHILIYTLLVFLSFFTLGIALPWVMIWHQKWYFDHVTLNGQRLAYEASGLELLLELIIVALLLLVTLGIYTFWAFPRLQKWHWSRTRVSDALDVTANVVN